MVIQLKVEFPEKFNGGYLKGDTIKMEKNEANDKRTLRRRHLIYYLRVFSANTGELMGHLVDVTQKGVMLISEKPFDPSQRYQFRMALPVEIWGADHFDFDALCMWSDRDINPDFYNAGFQLVNVDWKGMDIIERLIVQYGFSD